MHLLPLMTAEQFFALPEPVGNFTRELHFGEVVEVELPRKGLYDLQSRIRDLLVKTLGRKRWLAEIEMPYDSPLGTMFGRQG